MSMNKAILVGRLGQDAKVITTGEGDNARSFVAMSLATSEFAGKDDAGKTKTRTEWHRLVSFQPGLVTLANKGALTKGVMLDIDGKLHTRKYQKDGKDVFTTEVVINTLNILVGNGAKSNGADAPAKAEPALAQTAAGSDGEPF